ncbi:MmgE/PrpD family protein [Halorarius litoreus]|uniref:MmgE/PrpD family protein n=1 Tax=Halorarius litoreus TaxID=2962676 RepID=UPI0020CC46F6|nr:MmgE/PrpD family protein [Halorarius litoreus]
MDSPEDRAWIEHATAFLSAPIPDEARERGVQVVADVLSAAVAGVDAPANEQVATGMALPPGEASVLGTDRTTDPGSAALLNATAAITPEIEEGHNTGGHVGASIVVGGFALAEASDADGETLVEGVVKAYELCTRIENAVFLMKARMNEALPWLVRNPHSTWTTIGPAVAGAIAMGADEEAVAEAFRLGANLAVVSMHDPYEEGAPARNFTAGFSAQAGVNAALAAVAGLDGSRSAMTEVYDPLREMKGEAFDESFADLGEHWSILENYYKFTPSCRYTHAPLGALEQVVDDVRVDEVESVDVYAYRNACDLDYADYTTMTSAKFSIPFVLGRYLAVGGRDLWLDDFTGDALDDPETRSLAERVHMHHDQQYEALFPERWSARVEVTHTDGTSVEAECLDAPGDHRNFPGEDALVTKFERLLATRLDDAPGALDALLDVRDQQVRAVGKTLRP